MKEGISNAVKHSNGDRIDIIFREHPAFYQLLLEDNGHTDHTPAPAEGGSATSSTTSDDTGYAGRGPLSRGIGLRNMEDRAGSVGGRITFTQSEHGFRIFLTIPKGQA